MANGRRTKARDQDQPGHSSNERAARTPKQRGSEPSPVTPQHPVPVVGVGASAGGFEAFVQLLRAMPADAGVAMILVQHLAPAHGSMLVDLLAKETSLPVLWAEDGVAVSPGHVYVSPPSVTTTVVEGKLRLEAHPAEPRVRRMPVDELLRSLAADLEGRAIGIVLSGTGTDGTLGLREIKEQGGIALVQDPKTARFAGMPQSAIAEAAVDTVLPPDGIAREVLRLIRHPYVTAAEPELPGVAAEESGLETILRLLRAAHGIDFRSYKQGTVVRRTMRRMTLLGKENLEEYAAYCQEHPEEITALYHDVLIKVTGFFRDPDSYEVLKATILPALLLGRPPDRPFRVWVAGCSTGEEVYSLAIALLEWMDAAKVEPPSIQIFATDIDDEALAKARSGTYLENIAPDVSPERLQRFFTIADHHYRVNKQVRDLCTFAKHNLLVDPPFSNIDLVSCRNLLIYFDPAAQRTVIPGFHYALRPDGFLMLGPSESIGSDETADQLFALVDKKHKIYSRQGASTAMPLWKPLGLRSRRDDAEHASQSVPASADPGAGARQEPQESTVYREADRALLRRYAPAGVLINEHLDILQFRGDTSRFLMPSPGKASLSLLKMAREGLLRDVQAAIDEAKKTGQQADREGVTVSYDGDWLDVAVRVIPIRQPLADAIHYMVLFEESAPAQGQQSKRRRQGQSAAAGRREEERRTERLQDELESVKEFLHTAVVERDASNEELRSANEEVLSANEELQSTNEELETAKEELQSTNEELITSNEELQHRNDELVRSNNDLHNLFRSSHLPIVLLGHDLRIRQMSAVSENLLNIIPTDIGRPITDLRLNIQVPDLESLLHNVMATGVPVEREVQDRRKRWYLLRISPYKTIENETAGAVLVLVDVEALKDVERLKGLLEERQQAQTDAEAARSYAESIVETVQHPLLVLDEELRVRSANHAFYETFQMSAEETAGRLFQELENGQWNMPALRQQLDNVMAGNHALADYEVTSVFPRIGGRVMRLSARRVKSGDLQEGVGHLVLLAIEDITAAKEAQAKVTESEIRYRRLFETAKDGIFILDGSSGVIMDVNSFALDLLEYAREECVGKRFWGMEALAQSDVGPETLQAMQEEDYVRRDAVPLVTKSGRAIEVGVVCSAYFIEKRRVIQCIVHDVTESRQMQRDLELQARELEDTDRRKNEFLAMLSHELRNPLGPIRSAVELLDQAEDPAQQDVLDTLTRQVAILVRLIDELLDVARVTSGRIQLQPTDSNLNHIVQRTADTARPQMTEHGHRLSVSLADPAPWIHGDVGRLEQVIVNLLTNAAKYTPGSGNIWVSVDQEENEAVIRVKDSGMGIDPELLPHVFDLFSQGKRTLGRSESGLGVGLALVRSLVEMHGGTVTASSDGRGKGSEFVVRLPAVSAPAQEPAPAPPAEHEPPSGPPLRVLLVDDNTDMVSLMARLLRRWDHEVQTAHNGGEALEAVRQFHPDVVLLDIGLPDMDGYEVAGRMRQEQAGRDAVLVAMTGYGQPSDRQRSREAGFDHHLVKPAEREDLQRIFNGIQQSRQA